LVPFEPVWETGFHKNNRCVRIEIKPRGKFLGLSENSCFTTTFVMDTMRWKSYNLENGWDTFEKKNIRKENMNIDVSST
jgi:hypothetical protein